MPDISKRDGGHASHRVCCPKTPGPTSGCCRCFHRLTSSRFGRGSWIGFHKLFDFFLSMRQVPFMLPLVVPPVITFVLHKEPSAAAVFAPSLYGFNAVLWLWVFGLFCRWRKAVTYLRRWTGLTDRAEAMFGWKWLLYCSGLGSRKNSKLCRFYD